MPLPTFVIGLDLGQASDFSAMVTIAVTPAAPGEAALDVVDIRRWPLGSAYPSIVRDVRSMLSRPEMRPTETVRRNEWSPAIDVIQSPPPTLVIDATGVGRAVVDGFLAAGLPAEVAPVTITGGNASRQDSWSSDSYVIGYHVPKKDLVSAVQQSLQTKNLKIVPTLPLARELRDELLNFKARITLSANEQFGEWRSGKHDDLVLALAMATWMAIRDDDVATWGPNLTAGRW